MQLQDEVLLAQLNWNEPHMFRNRKDVPKPSGMFLLLPSHNGSLLIKPIATRELILPAKMTGYDQATESSLANITQRLDKVMHENVDLKGSVADQILYCFVAGTGACTHTHTHTRMCSFFSICRLNSWTTIIHS